MNKKYLAAVLAAFVFFSTSVKAKDIVNKHEGLINDVQLGYGVNLELLSFKPADVDTPVQQDDLKRFKALSGMVGVRFFEVLSAEIRLGAGIEDDSKGGVDIKLKNYYGGYLKLRTGILWRLSSYMLVGGTRTEFEVSDGSVPDDYRDFFSWGVGVDIGHRGRHGTNLEFGRWLRYDSGNTEYIDSVRVGIIFPL